MSGSSLRTNNAVASRIKKMMQSDEDVGKVAKASPVLIAAALDSFIETLVTGASSIAQERGAKMLTASHLKSQIHADKLLDFCKAAVENVADLPPPDEQGAVAEKPKRQRTKATGEGAKPKRAKAAKKKKTADSEDDDEDYEPENDDDEYNPPAAPPQQRQQPAAAATNAPQDNAAATGQGAGGEANEQNVAVVAGVPTFVLPVVGDDGAAAEEDEYD